MAKQDKQYVIEPMPPIINAAQGSTEAQLAVIVTSPARMPLVRAWKSIRTSYFYPVILFLRLNVSKPDVAGARIVLIIALSDYLLSPLVMPPEEPALKKSHPNQRIKVPRTAC